MVGEGSIGENIVGRGRFAKRDKEQAAPPGVVPSAEFKDDGNESLEIW